MNIQTRNTLCREEREVEVEGALHRLGNARFLIDSGTLDTHETRTWRERKIKALATLEKWGVPVPSELAD